MLTPIAVRLLTQHYLRMFKPLTDCTVTRRVNTLPRYPDLAVMRMLARRPDGGLMQVLATIGASAVRLPRRKGSPARRN